LERDGTGPPPGENGTFVPGLRANRKKLKTPVLHFNMLETKIFETELTLPEFY